MNPVSIRAFRLTPTGDSGAAGEVGVVDRTITPVRRGDVLITDLACGVCGTDTAKRFGTETLDDVFWGGHEFAGRVADPGSRTDLEIGQHVVGWPPIGWPYGGMATKVYVPSRYALAIPELPSTRIDPRIVGALAEPFMCMVMAMLRTYPLTGPLSHGGTSPLQEFGYEPHTARTFIVWGAGQMSLGAIACANLENPRAIIAIARSEAGRDRALRAGATHVIDSSDRTVDSVIAEAKGLLGGIGADVAVEGIGEQWAVNATLKSARFDGLAVLGGFHQSDEGIRVVKVGEYLGWHAVGMPSGHTRDAATIGLPPAEDVVAPGIQLALKFFANGLVDPDLFLGDKLWSLDDADAAFARARRGGGAGKQIIDTTLAATINRAA